MKVKLGELFSITSGGTPDRKKSEYYENGTIPWIKTGDLKDKYVSTDVDLITEAGLKNSSAKLFPPRTVLVAMYGATIGACSILPYEASTNQACAAFLPYAGVIPEYLYYFLCSRQKQFVKDGVGGAQPNISAGYLKAVDFDVPSLVEQQKTVSVIDKVYYTLTKRKQQLQKLDELVKARFVEMFGNPVTNDKSWSTISLDDACDGIGDGLHGTPEYDDNGEYPFINGNNLIDGMIMITPTTKMVDEATYRKHYIKISDNAILLSINGTLGKMALYRGEKVMLGKSACYCNLKPTINREFVYGLMISDTFAEFLESNSTKSTIKNVGLKAIRGFPLIIPPDELQLQFVSFARQVDKSKSSIQASLDQLETLKQSLMQKYFG